MKRDIASRNGDAMAVRDALEGRRRDFSGFRKLFDGLREIRRETGDADQFRVSLGPVMFETK